MTYTPRRSSRRIPTSTARRYGSSSQSISNSAKVRIEENERARTELAATLRKMLDAGYSMGDLGRELGTSRQAVYDLLKRAERY